MSAAAQSKAITLDEYVRVERASAVRHEYFDGTLHAKTGASRAHNLISINIGGELSAQLRGRACEVYAGNMRVLVSATGACIYPDIVAVCGEPRFEDAEFDTLLNPALIFEILAPSTEADDRGGKFAQYQRVPSLQEYVLVAQSRRRIERFRRQGDEWRLTVFDAPGALVSHDFIACRLSLAEVYDKVDTKESG